MIYRVGKIRVLTNLKGMNAFTNIFEVIILSIFSFLILRYNQLYFPFRKEAFNDENPL
jgi:hypothetical protein